jgi:hypothetical protein
MQKYVSRGVCGSVSRDESAQFHDQPFEAEKTFVSRVLDENIAANFGKPAVHRHERKANSAMKVPFKSVPSGPG